ncbi:MAG: hypothetical protein PHT19_09820 [Methylococcus sp.]|nr:hypothetical protein [Methylococcus sp.]
MKLKESLKVAEMTHERIVPWIVRMIIGAGILVLFLFCLYFYHFYMRSSVADSPETWGQFGDFVDGTANPILQFLTLTALALTIILQSRQLSISSRELELSRKALKMTRNELTRSIKAQEASEKALTAQAAVAEKSVRLSAIKLLLSHYQDQIKDLQGKVYLGDEIELELKRQLEEREAVLKQLLENAFDEVVQPGS